MKRIMSFEQYETLRLYVEERNKENWGLWPAVETWPVPESLGAFTATQYEARKSNTTTVLKFDHTITLPNGETAKKLGVGRFQPFEMTSFKRLDKSECDSYARQIELLPRLKAVNFCHRIDDGAVDGHVADASFDQIAAEVGCSPHDVRSCYYM